METYPTSDFVSASVDAGAGKTFMCLDNPSSFFCVEQDDAFTCHGWSNCSALGATIDASGLEVFEPIAFATSWPAGAPVSTPEPSSLLLPGLGVAAALFKRFGRYLHLAPRVPSQTALGRSAAREADAQSVVRRVAILHG